MELRPLNDGCRLAYEKWMKRSGKIGRKGFAQDAKRFCSFPQYSSQVILGYFL